MVGDRIELRFRENATNPAYGGTYAYGKTGAATVYDSSAARQGVRRKPREDWLALRPGAHKGYVAWGTIGDDPSDDH